MPKKKTSANTLNEYTKKRNLPLSFLTEDTEEELSDNDLLQMTQIVSYPIFKKRVDAHLRKAFLGMNKDTFEVQRQVMDAFGAFALEFENSLDALAEAKAKEKRIAEMSVPNPFPSFDLDEDKGDIPDE